MHRARAAATVLNIRLREILREELGGTYGVVGRLTTTRLPLKGYGAMRHPVRQLARERRQAGRTPCSKEIERLKTEGPSADDVSKVKELERRDLETNAKQNSYWLGSMQTVHMYGWDPVGIARRERAHRAADAGEHQGMFKKYFPTGPLHARHAEAGVERRARLRAARPAVALLSSDLASSARSGLQYHR